MPSKMIQKTLDVLKGWPRPHALDFQAKFNDAIKADYIPQGRVMHIDPATGKLAYGVDSLDVMPLVLWSGSQDFDVQNNGGDAAVDKGVWVPISPSGAANTLVAIGAYEVLSTEFMDASYAPNDLLTALEADGGKVSKGTKYDDTICGMVSRGVVPNAHGYDALAFWPMVILPT